MPKCDFNRFAAYFQSTFSKGHHWMAVFVFPSLMFGSITNKPLLPGKILKYNT